MNDDLFDMHDIHHFVDNNFNRLCFFDSSVMGDFIGAKLEQNSDVQTITVEYDQLEIRFANFKNHDQKSMTVERSGRYDEVFFDLTRMSDDHFQHDFDFNRDDGSLLFDNLDAIFSEVFEQIDDKALG